MGNFSIFKFYFLKETKGKNSLKREKFQRRERKSHAPQRWNF